MSHSKGGENMFENKEKYQVVHSFEDLSLEEMQALQADTSVEAEITPSTTVLILYWFWFRSFSYFDYLKMLITLIF